MSANCARSCINILLTLSRKFDISLFVYLKSELLVSVKRDTGAMRVNFGLSWTFLLNHRTDGRIEQRDRWTDRRNA